MGFQDRDYTRGGGYTDSLGGWGFNLDAVPVVVKRLVAANVIVFLLQIFTARDPTLNDSKQYLDRHPEMREFAAEYEAARRERAADDPSSVNEEPPLYPWLSDRISIVEQWLELDTDKVIYQGQVWRLLTCAFCHHRGGLLHILFNMLFLWWFGQTIETMYGSREFLLFYLTAALLASLAFIGLDLATGNRGAMIGASGAVMAVMMVYAGYYPRSTIRIFFLFPVEIRWLVLIWVLFDLHPVLLALSGDPQADGVAHAAHLGGLAFGFLYWKQQWRLEPLWERLPRFRKSMRAWRSGLRVVRPPERKSASADELDRILAKIHETGRESLTDKERKFLERESERYRNR